MAPFEVVVGFPVRCRAARVLRRGRPRVRCARRAPGGARAGPARGRAAQHGGGASLAARRRSQVAAGTRQVVDQAAAVVILQAALDAERASGRSAGVVVVPGRDPDVRARTDAVGRPGSSMSDMSLYDDTALFPMGRPDAVGRAQRSAAGARRRRSAASLLVASLVVAAVPRLAFGRPSARCRPAFTGARRLRGPGYRHGAWSTIGRGDAGGDDRSAARRRRGGQDARRLHRRRLARDSRRRRDPARHVPAAQADVRRPAR